MKRPPGRKRRRIALALLLLPPLFWAAVLAVTPTEWARARIVARLGEATRRPTRLGKVKLGALGAVYLVDLEIGAPGSNDDPWLKVQSARINVSVLQLVVGQIEPSNIEVCGVSLRVRRRPDGTLELADLLQTPPKADRAAGSPEENVRPSIEVRVKDGRIEWIDEPSHTRLVLARVEGRASVHDHLVAIPELRGDVNQGHVELIASLDRTAEVPHFEAQIRAVRVGLDEGTNALSYAIPVLSGAPGDVPADGRVDARLYLKGQGVTREALRGSLVGQGTINVDPITLERSQFFAELDRLIDLPEQAHIGSIRSDFVIKDNRVSTENLTINIAQVPIVLRGWTDFDGRVDYKIRSDAVADRLPGKARELLADMAIDTGGLASLRLAGTLQDMQVDFDADALDPRGVRGNTPRPSGDREKLRDLGRRFRDRLLR